MSAPESEERKYEKLWNDLKTKEFLQLELPRESHKSLLQALRRESARDSLYRFKAVDRGQSYVIRYNSVGVLLFIRIEWKDSIPSKFTYKAGK